MQPVFKCDFCSFMGSQQEVQEHTRKCTNNFERKNCLSCVHKSWEGVDFKCDCGKHIPAGQMIEFCDQYEYKKKVEPLLDFRNMWWCK